MTIVAHNHPFVVGVDTHARSHALSVIVATTGEEVGSKQFPASAAGLAKAMAWVGRTTGADLDTLWVIEGAATFGARLAALVEATGYRVVEAARMSARGNRGLGKSDPLDARRIATAVLRLPLDRLRNLRQDSGARSGLRVLVAAREMMTTERTAAINALTALLRAADLGIDARKPLTATQIAEVTRWRARNEEIGLSTARTEAIRLAKRIIALGQDLEANKRNTVELLELTPAKALLNEPGIGPITAAVAMTSWSHAGRLRDEAAFASLAGVNPIPASSGNTVRYRLNRGGDRRLNRALHTAVITRMRFHEETKTYVQRRTAEGKTTKEIRRCLKRYLARQIYRTLNANTISAPNTTPTAITPA